MEPAASKDSLTKFYTESSFIALLDKEITRSKRFSRPFAVLIMKFKPSSPEAKNYSAYPVLKKCGKIVSDLIRTIDIPGRIGEKLALGMPETNRDGAVGMARRILGQVKDVHFSAEDYDFGIVCEIGTSLCPENGATAKDLVKAAEKALQEKPIKA